MAGIQTYNDLLNAIVNYLDGEAFDGPTMVQLAEADFRRTIVSADQEVPVPFSTASPNLPADADSIRSLALTGTPNGVLSPVSASEFAALPLTTTGMPISYMLSNNTVSLWPVPDAVYTGTLIYRQILPALSVTNQTNWLLQTHPDAYLFGSLLQAEFFGWNDERLPLLQAKLSDVLSSINDAAQRQRYSGGPLTVQIDAYTGPYSDSVPW